MRHIVLIAFLAFILAACQTAAPEQISYRVQSDADLAKHIALVFAHGLGAARTPGRCQLGATETGWGTPNAVVDLEDLALMISNRIDPARHSLASFAG